MVAALAANSRKAGFPIVPAASPPGWNPKIARQPAPAEPLCPKDGSRLMTTDHYGVTVEECPSCHGMWLDAGELEKIASRERDSWLGRIFLRPRDR